MLRKSLRDNTDLLLGEIMRLHRGPKQELPRYVQQLVSSLSDVENEQRSRLMQRALEVSKSEYQLHEKAYTERNAAMLTSFP